MDLNRLYSEHQLLLMRAAEAGSRPARTRHLAAAGDFARSIRNYQAAQGAPAASDWHRAALCSERFAFGASALAS